MDGCLNGVMAVAVKICAPLGLVKLSAKCQISPKGKPCGGGPENGTCNGVVTFTMIAEDKCQVTWDLTGCGREGLHGFHIHEKADFSDGCNSCGPHYNPFGKSHGGPKDTERHVGDLGNIYVDRNGRSKGEMVDHLLRLSGPYSIIGRSVMVHADQDDLGRGDNSQPGVNGKTSKTTGNAGPRIGCGEIVYG